ncbi:DNA gyrase inhibitory protein [Klebsiella grimontii]|uniref:DNA gyrase inhibitory protein n=1 Tax=Klebsiella grimontii TaxID=2058152 RepID=A0A7H4P0N2_9ENTR|nr:DNA gyrase inhibitory protein [Klebsiella grimontii]
MEYNVKSVGKKKIAGFHLVGPWEQTVKQGFEQLMMWVDNSQVSGAGVGGRLLRQS